MKKVTKLKGIVSPALQMRYLEASEEQRRELRPLIEEESQWMLDKMSSKGYQLEATVAEVFGVFTRGSAKGTVRLVSGAASEATSR